MANKIIPLIPQDGVHKRVITLNGSAVEVGDFTGRCFECGSQNLWDDETAYGCNDCHFTRVTGQLSPASLSI